jgi:hypothetical protein
MWPPARVSVSINNLLRSNAFFIDPAIHNIIS